MWQTDTKAWNDTDAFKGTRTVSGFVDFGGEFFLTKGKVPCSYLCLDFLRKDWLEDQTTVFCLARLWQQGLAAPQGCHHIHRGDPCLLLWAATWLCFSACPCSERRISRQGERLSSRKWPSWHGLCRVLGGEEVQSLMPFDLWLHVSLGVRVLS